jgi:F0F1-type ATP synthase beta subunit
VDGNVGLFGIQGVGRIVLVEELLHRFGKTDRGAQIFYLVHRNEPESVRGMLWQESGYPGDTVGSMQVVWLLSDQATEPAAARAIEPFDASIYCHPVLGARGLWPAVDPLLSNSSILKREIVGAEHVETAGRAHALLKSRAS